MHARGIIPSKWAGTMMSLMRFVFGFLFFMHGTQKFFGWPAPFPMELEAFSRFGIAATLETVGGALMMLGLFTRPVAFILAGEMAVAFFWIHLPSGFWPLNNGGEAAALYCFAWLFFAAAGPGTIAIDRPHLVAEKHK